MCEPNRAVYPKPLILLKPDLQIDDVYDVRYSIKQGFGSRFWPKTPDPGLCSSNVVRF